MKKILVRPIRGESKYYCDKHPDRECFSEVRTMYWYGSQFDLLNLNMNLCDECMDKFYAYVKETFGVEPVECELTVEKCNLQ